MVDSVGGNPENNPIEFGFTNGVFVIPAVIIISLSGKIFTLQLHNCYIA